MEFPIFYNEQLVTKCPTIWTLSYNIIVLVGRVGFKESGKLHFSIYYNIKILYASRMSEVNPGVDLDLYI